MGGRFWFKIGCLVVKKVVLCGGEFFVFIREFVEGIFCVGWKVGLRVFEVFF